MSIDAEIIRESLRKCGIFSRLLYLHRTSSTSDVAKSICAKEHAHGVLILAEEQTAGRGRNINRWLSARGKGLYFSLVLQPATIDNIQVVTLAAGVAVASAVEQSSGVAARLKWPNDVYIQEKKVSGILTEAVFKGDKLENLVVGIGVNVNHDKEDFGDELLPIATSLKISTGKTFQREIILINILKAFDRTYKMLLGGNTSEVLKQWYKKALYLGEELIVEKENNSVMGKFVGLNDAGALILEDCNKRTHKIWAADVIKCRKKPQEPKKY